MTIGPPTLEIQFDVKNLRSKFKIKITPVNAASSWLISLVFHMRASCQLPSFHDNRASHSRYTNWPWIFKVKGQGQRTSCTLVSVASSNPVLLSDLFYVTSRFVHHFIAISEFKIELQSENAQFGAKSIFLSRMTLKFDKWPWKTIRHLSYAASSFVHHSVAIGEFKSYRPETPNSGQNWPNF